MGSSHLHGSCLYSATTLAVINLLTALALGVNLSAPYSNYASAPLALLAITSFMNGGMATAISGVFLLLGDPRPILKVVCDSCRKPKIEKLLR